VSSSLQDWFTDDVRSPETPETNVDDLEALLATPEPKVKATDTLDDSGYCSPAIQAKPALVTDHSTCLTYEAPAVQDTATPTKTPVKIKQERNTEDENERLRTTVISRLSQDPNFQELHQTLLAACDDETEPVTLIQSQKESTTELSIAKSALTIRLMTLEQQTGEVATNLHNFYKFQMSQFESERYYDLYTTQTSKVLINTHYDNLQHEVIDRITKSVNLLESKMLLQNREQKRKREEENATSTKKRRPVFSCHALTILNEWYNTNINNPYPTPESVQVLSHAAEISPDQIKKWLSNKRARNNNTTKKR
jgi:hypothetical protein